MLRGQCRLREQSVAGNDHTIDGGKWALEEKAASNERPTASAQCEAGDSRDRDERTLLRWMLERRGEADLAPSARPARTGAGNTR